MRQAPDRIRHAILFEVIGLLLVVPMGQWLFDLPLGQMGVVSIGSATVATLWNYVYNLMFDKAMLFWTNSVEKNLFLRLLHAFLFEFGLVFLLLPPIAWYLNISFWDAFWMDAVLVVFYLIYAFIYNWLYDHIFPIPNLTSTQSSSANGSGTDHKTSAQKSK